MSSIEEGGYLERTFIYMMSMFQFVWFDAYEDYSCFCEVSFFAVSKVSKWNKEQRLSFV
jgi:hypothetical protein